MLIVAGTITIDPAQVERFSEAATQMMLATHEEPGNIAYVFSVNVADPGSIEIFEVWEAAQDLDRHMTLPHMTTFRAALKELTVTGRSISRYEVASHEPM